MTTITLRPLEHRVSISEDLESKDRVTIEFERVKVSLRIVEGDLHLTLDRHNLRRLVEIAKGVV